LEAAGIDRNTPVTTRLRDIRFSKALETILRDVGGGTVQLTYTVDDGVVMISTAEDLSRNTVTRVYDIRDLIVETPDFYGPQFSLENASQGSGSSGGGQSLFQSQQQQQQQETTFKTRDDRVAEITSLMQETVSPDSWRDAGGTVGSLRELNGQLIVTQTPENQRQIEGLLEQLRETRAIQITVETRFLTVQRNFLEDVGFDFDFIFNGNNPLQKYDPTGGADPNAVAKVPGTGSWSAVPVINNSSSFTGPGTVTTGAPGTLNREFTAINGLTAAGTFLDDFQVSFLIRATQAQRQTTLLTAPRLTLFNGQTAYVLVAVQQPYVSDLQPVVGTQAVAFDPTISTVNSGVMLQVQATVSADRKYVTMTLQPTLQTLLALVNFSFQQSNNTTGVTSGGQLINTSAGSGIIQEPVTQITQVSTSVSVPDGGTLLLGGQTIAGETELEAGVPVLSKIPFLKRLFTNKSTAKDEQVLLILVKPTIIIQRELEEKQFPLLSQRVGG
jgi:general secretion pathway protein D